MEESLFGNMKYRVKYTDSSWLFFTPFAFLNMGGTNHWAIQSKKGLFGKWKNVGDVYSQPEDCYIEYFKLKYNINIEKRKEFKHNRKKNKTVYCFLDFRFNNYSTEFRYCVGYKPTNYARYYHCCYSSESYEDALMRLYTELQVKELINK